MPLFEYKGFTAKGRAINGTLEADGPADLRAKLVKDGTYLTSFHEAGGAGARKAQAAQASQGIFAREVNFKAIFQRVRPTDVAVMTRQFGTLLRAGVPMSESLSALYDQQERETFKVVISRIREKVREGTSLADALGEHPKVFPELYVNMVRVGEASGTLEIVLDRLADFLESNVRLKGKITAAMIYPLMMGGVASLIVAVMMVFVIPKISELFSDMGGQLPILTRILIGTSNLFINTWYIALPLMILAFWYFRKYVRTDSGRLRWDGFKLKVPIFGAVVRLVAVARFGRTLATLLSSGVPVLSSLDIVKTIVNNVVLANAIDDAKVAVREGESLAGPLQRSGHFPPMMTHMIAIGERTGQLEAMLKNVADAYDNEVDARVTTLTSVLEPVMIAGMGVMVAFLVFAILMPMLQMNEVIAGQ